MTYSETTDSIQTVSSVDNLPDEVSTDRLEEFKIQVGRSDFVEIANDVARRQGFEFHSSYDDEELVRSIRTDKFRVDFIASHPRYLELNWLYTTAYLSNGRLKIESSARYNEDLVEEKGQETIIRYINEDRRELGRIAESYCSFRRSPKVFDARVEVHRDKLGVVGHDTLGQCIYDSYEELFFSDGYGEDLLRGAIQESRETIADVKQDLCTL